MKAKGMMMNNNFRDGRRGIGASRFGETPQSSLMSNVQLKQQSTLKKKAMVDDSPTEKVFKKNNHLNSNDKAKRR